jgi:hypothetical protein
MLIWRTMSLTFILRRVLWGGVALGLIFYLVLTLWLAHSAIFFPYQLDYGEGIVLWFTRELALGHSIYKGLEGLPYATSNYPPLALALAIPFRSLFGNTYIGGRWLNFAAALIVAAFIYRIVGAESSTSPLPSPLPSHLKGEGSGEGGRMAGALSAFFFLGSTFVYHWIPLFRVDLIGLAFTVAGIFFVWYWQSAEPALRLSKEHETHTTRHELYRAFSLRPATFDLGVAVLFFLAAIYTKHSLFLAPAAAIVAIFLRNRRAAVVFALGLALSAGAIFLGLDALTHGGFAFGLVTSNATLWLWTTLLSLTGDFLWTYLVLIAFALLAWVVRVRAKRVGVLETYAFAAIASLVFAGRVGAWQNYYLEAIFVVCVFAGLACAPMLRRGLTAPWWLPILLLIQLGLFWREHDPAIARDLMETVRGGNRHVAPLVRAQQGIVISEDMGLLVTNGKPVDYYTFQYSSLARSGQWDQHWELENLSAGTFPLVILSQGTREDVDHFRDFTREFVSALDYNYGLSLEDARYKVYEPAPLAHLREDDFDGQLALRGWSLVPEENARAGRTLTLTVVWEAEKQLNARYTAFAHLEDARGGVVAQDDHEPRVGVFPELQWYPTTHWAASEMVRDTFALSLPANLMPGVYSLRVGWYDPLTQDRLSVAGGADFVELQKLETKP